MDFTRPNIPHLLNKTYLKFWRYPSFQGEVVNILLEKRRRMMTRSRTVPYYHSPERIFIFITSRSLEYKPIESNFPQECFSLVNVSVTVLF